MRLLALAALALALAAPAQASRSVVYGVSDPNFSGSWAALAQPLAASGASQVGLWLNYDCGSTKAPALGVPASQPALVTLAGLNSCFPLTPAARAAYAAKVAKLVLANPNVREVQVWNESEGRFTAAQYVPLLAATYDAVHAASGSVAVLAWGAHPASIVAAGDHPAWMHMTIVDFAAAVRHYELVTARAVPLMDGLAYHPYWGWSPPVTRQLVDYLNASWATGAQPSPRRGLRFWWTETGAWSSGAQWNSPPMVLGSLGQARRVYDVALAARCSRYVVADFNYMLADAGISSWTSGLLDASRQFKPAFYAFAAGVGEARGAHPCSRRAVRSAA